MRLQPPDQLSIALIFASAIFMAAKQGVESWPAATRALPQMSAGWLSFVPLVLLLVAGIRSIVISSDPSGTKEPVPSDGQLVSPDTGNQTMDQRNRRSTISSIDLARRMAGSGTKGRSERDAEKEWPRMQAALLSAHKEFGVPMPPTGYGALFDLEFAKRLLEKVVPLIQAGHDEEARQAAQMFIENFKPEEPPQARA